MSTLYSVPTIPDTECTIKAKKEVIGVAVPVSGKSLEMVPEADRLKDYMTFYSKTTNPLTISSDGTISDSVIYEGKRYKLINGQNFSRQGFWKAMGINEDGK